MKTAASSGAARAGRRASFALPALLAVLGVSTMAVGLFGAAPAAAHEGNLTPHGTPYVYLSAQDRSIAASWGEPNEAHNPPTRDHDSPVTKHQVWYKESTSQSWTTVDTGSADRNYTITGLSNGKSYNVAVNAINANGIGGISYSNFSIYLPGSKPSAPTSVSGTAGDSSVALSWTFSNTSGSAITKWEYRQRSAGSNTWSSWKDICETTETNRDCPRKRAHTAASLTNGTSYTFQIRGKNRLGYSPESSSSASVVPAGAPPKPTTPTVAGGNASVTLASSVADNGGSAITKWKYTKAEKPAGQSDFGGFDSSWTEISSTSLSLSHTVTGLTNGTAYKFKVRAVNALGDGAESDESGETTPSASAPATLTASGVTATTAKLAVANWSGAWSYKDGQKGHYISCTNVAAGTAEASLSGLTPGRDYLVYAWGAHNCPVNDNTWGRARSVIFTTLLPKVEGVSVSASGVSLSVGWTAQSGVTGYHVQWKSGSEDWSSDRQSDAATNSAAISNLIAGTSYTVRVRSYHKGYKNRIKYGQWSEPATGAAEQLAVTLTASSVTHDSATLTIVNRGGGWHYKANAAPHASCSSSAVSGTRKDLTGLSGNTSYTYKAYSDSSCSSASELASADAFLTKPGKPDKPTAAAGAGSGKLTLSSSVGGDGKLTKWQYTKDNGTTWANIAVTSTALSYTVENLTDGTNYTFQVRAVNATGTGPDSEASDAAQPSAKPPGSTVPEGSATVPPAPSRPVATAGRASAALSWRSGGSGGSAITGWQYATSKDNFGSWHDLAASGTDPLTATVTGLDNGTEYRFRVRAVNGEGGG